jgi:hypothetical protein
MKTISLSSIAFACLCLFNSCTKESSEISTTSSFNNLSTARVAAPGTLPQNGTGNNDVVPEMTITYNPNPGIVNQPVTVTASLTGSNIPDCGKLQLQQLIDGDWVGITGAKTTVSSTVHELTYTFTPTVVGTAAYSFQLHYVAGNCDGFREGKSGGFPLDVIEPCQGLTFTGSATAEPSSAGKYLFTVTYTVNPCGLQFDKLKTQGGLTNAVEFISAEGGLINSQNWVPGTSTNKIIKWEENTPGTLLPTTKRVYVIKFEKAYAGTGSIELTGDWSTSASLNGVDAGYVQFPKIYYQP